MAYQLIFSSHKRSKETSGYDMENVTKLTKRVGKEDEDTPLEDVVQVIKSQLARRDVLVTGVEVFELVKKKVKFKEIKGGFIIKDKKFLMDQIQGVPVATDDDDVAVPSLPPQLAGLQPHEILLRTNPAALGLGPQQVAQASQQPVPAARPPMIPQQLETGVPMPLHPQRFEIFDPDPRQQAILNGRYKLTPGQKYPIFREWRDVGNVTHYLIKDDRGMEIQLSAEYFVAPGRGLIGGNFEADPMERKLNQGLAFQGKFLEDRGGSMGGPSLDYPMDGEEIPEALMRMPDITHLRGRV